MLPVILIAVGAYLIGDSVLKDKKYAKGGEMAKGGKVKMPEWAVTVTSEDGDSHDWDGFAKDEDDALTKAEKEAGFDSVESSVMMITDENGEKIEYKKGGEMAKGGAIKNQYEGKTAEQVWEKWTEQQRSHFLLDHSELLDKDRMENNLGYTRTVQKDKNFTELTPHTKRVLESHVKTGQYAKGGKLVGKQKNLDVNKNGKLDAEDFKMLRGEKMSDGGEIATKLKMLKEKSSGYFPNIEPTKETSYYLWETPKNEKTSFIIERRSIYSDVGSGFYVYDKDYKFKGSANELTGFKDIKPIRITKSDIKFDKSGK